MAAPSNQPGRPVPPPGKGLFGWLGRQIGHVSKAVATDVTAVPSASPSSQPIYREQRTEEVPHPTDPNVVLRRTVIDEAVKAEPK